MLLASLGTYTHRQANTHKHACTHARTQPESCRVIATFPGQLLGPNLHKVQGESGLWRSTAPTSSFDRDGEGYPAPCSVPHPDLFLSRYQEVQAAQTALGTAVAEVLPRAEKTLTTVKQVFGNTAPHLGSLVSPEAMVSLTSPELLMGWQ